MPTNTMLSGSMPTFCNSNSQQSVFLDTNCKGGSSGPTTGIDSGQLSSTETSSPGSVSDNAVFDLGGSGNNGGSCVSDSGAGIALNRLKSIDSGILMTTASSQPSPSSSSLSQHHNPSTYDQQTPPISSHDVLNDCNKPSHSPTLSQPMISTSTAPSSAGQPFSQMPMHSNPMQFPGALGMQMQQHNQFKDMLLLKDPGQSSVGQPQYSPVGSGMNPQFSTGPNSFSKMDIASFNMMMNPQSYGKFDKEDKLSLQNSLWAMTAGDDSLLSGGNGGTGLFNPSGMGGPNQAQYGAKRAITGGNNVMRGGSASPFIAGGNTGGRSIWGGGAGSGGGPTGPAAGYGGHTAGAAINQKAWMQQSSSSPWNQALANQKMGLAPTSVNAMNLNNCGSNNNSFQNQRQPGPPSMPSQSSTMNNPAISNVFNSFPKKPQHRVPLHKQFDFSAVSGSGNMMPGNQGGNSGLPSSGSGDGSMDPFSNANALSGQPGGLGGVNSLLEKSSPLDTFKYSLEPHLLDLMKPTDGGPASGLNLDDPIPQDQFNLIAAMGQYPGMFGSLPQREERFSRKVFVGGLPPDIDEEEITTAFRRFGQLVVDWPHKAESKSYFPPKGYCFLLFQDELSVQHLIEACIMDESKYYWCVSSPTIKDKPVQIRPWNLADSDFVMDGSQPLDPRKTIFVGGVPRPLRAIELARIMDVYYGGVCYAGIDTDPELKYPKGAGRVAFSNQQSYISAISARFVQLQHNDIDKRVEVKPYVLDDQMCDECQGARCAGKFAPFFCANVTCLQYYCEQCWAQIHSRQGREYHKPLVKEGADRPRTVPFRW